MSKSEEAIDQDFIYVMYGEVLPYYLHMVCIAHCQKNILAGKCNSLDDFIWHLNYFTHDMVEFDRILGMTALRSLGSSSISHRLSVDRSSSAALLRYVT